ncbi:MAG: DUF445 family protein [Treponema sp.]|jgi:uncharacterized membrane protein YheB (UPF0754 family)|nr:DUF445 family protein [Treponema sp.]
MSISMIGELAIAIASGAGVGWITNAVAVNMLFRKYGRWGGVIEERYEEFIENMARLVEDDLVNHKTLQGEFDSPAFKAVLYAWIEDLLKKELPEKSGFIRFEEIPGIEQSVERLIKLVREHDHALADSIYKISKHKEIRNIVSEEQYKYLIDAGVKAVLSGDAPYEQELKNILYIFLSSRVINTLVSQEAVDRITENIGRGIQNIDFSQYDGSIDHAYNALLELIGIDRVIGGFEQSLGQMRFADFIKDPEHLSQELISRLIRFSGSPAGQALLLEIINNLLHDGKNIKLKIGDMVSPAIKSGIVNFINEKLPGIIDRIAGYIDETGEEIEQIINNTVDRHLESFGGSFFLKNLKDLFIDDLAKQFNVVNNIISTIHKHGDTVGSRLAKEILSFIETNSIGDIIAILQEQNILTPQGLAAIINLNLRDLPRKNSNVIEKLLYTKVGAHFKPDVSKIKTVLLPKIINKVKHEYLYRNAFKEDVRSKITAKITETVNRPCKELFGAQDIPSILKEQMIREALLHQWNQVSVTKISAILPENAIKNARIPWEFLWNRCKHHELNHIYRALQKEAVYTQAAEKVLEFLNRHLDKIVTGNVSNLVNSELRKSNPAQIRTMVQDFIGKELKPINIFGAFLGAIVGGISVWVSSLLGAPREFTWRLLLGYGAIFAAAGIGTNWLAIKMLFRPYKKILFPVCPFIGVVAARKPEFAENISTFVKERAFNDATVTEFLRKHKKALQEKIGPWTADSGYVITGTQRPGHITGFIFSAIQEYITRHSSDAADSIVKLLKEAAASGKQDDYLSLLGGKIIKTLQESDIGSYIYTIVKKEIESKTLGQYTGLISGFADFQITNVFKPCVNELTLENIKQMLYRYNGQFISYISTHSFEDFAGTQAAAGLAQGMSEKAGELLYMAIGPIVKYFEDKEFNPDTKLRELFNGNITGLIERHISYFLDLICQETGTQKGALVKQIQDAMPWYAAPAKGHVPPIVDILIDEELPKFLMRKKEHILSITDSLLEYRLSHLGFRRDMLNVAVIEQTVSGVLNAPQVRQNVTHFVRVIAEQYTRVPLKSVLALLNSTAIHDLVTIAEPVLAPAVSYIKFRLMQDDVSALMTKCMEDAIHKTAGRINVSDLLIGLDLEQELKRLVMPLIQDETVMDAVSHLVVNILLNITKNSNFYSDAILRKDMERFIAALDWESLRPGCIPLLKTFLQRLNKTITIETKQAIYRECLIPAVLDAAENHFGAVIHSIDIQKVVEREVNAMHPREIETLFNKFAGTYFTKITLYGWIGVFGGLLSYIIGCLLGWFM